MQAISFTRKSLILSLALAVVSCQSTVGAGSNEQNNSIPVADNFTQKVKAIAQKYPPLYRVSWNVCGVQKRVSIGKTVKNQCVDTQSSRLMLLWGATGAHKLIPTHQYVGGFQSHLFIESKGCFGLDEPSDTAQYYKARTFLVGQIEEKDKFKPTAQVKLTQLSDKEKEDAIADLITNPPETFSPVVTPDDCQSEQKWTSVYAPAIPASYK
ncbi:hypothetical protein [Nostoc sp. FACHB-280]|uniref:hypothetical protein n=1 Tax=Nostoc sp. FACHB-280 TaxID=2692839 RepID=UPI00168A841A|nr:hypothetical protein [Nostoc sp. FACHB-280]MBD2498329.1 hypothetical protein [Nostoc sp. FACHB-280]